MVKISHKNRNNERHSGNVMFQFVLKTLVQYTVHVIMSEYSVGHSHRTTKICNTCTCTGYTKYPIRIQELLEYVHA